MHSAHARIRMHTYARTAHTHICTHTCTQSCTSGARALTTRPPPRRRSRQGRCERGGEGTHRYFNLGQSAAAGSAASSVPPASLRANRAAAPCGSGTPLNARRAAFGPPRTRTCRTRAPAMRARGSAEADDRQRHRRRIQRRMVRPSARRGSARAAAQRRHRRQRARRRGGAGRTDTVRACTGRATRGAPSPSWTG